MCPSETTRDLLHRLAMHVDTAAHGSPSFHLSFECRVLVRDSEQPLSSDRAAENDPCWPRRGSGRRAGRPSAILFLAALDADSTGVEVSAVPDSQAARQAEREGGDDDDDERMGDTRTSSSSSSSSSSCFYSHKGSSADKRDRWTAETNVKGQRWNVQSKDLLAPGTAATADPCCRTRKLPFLESGRLRVKQRQPNPRTQLTVCRVHRAPTRYFAATGQ